MSGYKYYIVFVDDYSRFTWIYPLRTKAEAFETFVKFKLFAENNFSTKIKQLQSDGGGEFTSLQFQSCLTNHGIVYRKTCPYTSPQNGIAERKLRHILETGLTLLAHAHLSNKHWHDSFLTVVHVINRLPTATLHQLSPYEKLYNQPPDYTKLRVFGCLCYPLLRPYGLHKLEYRSKPCIFLGYQYAGYKCLDPVTNKVYLSLHVVFDETSFPAKEHVATTPPSRLPSTGDVIIPLPLLNSNITTSSLNSTAPTPPASSPLPAVSPTSSDAALQSSDAMQDPDITPPSHSLTEPISPTSPSSSHAPVSHSSPASDSLVPISPTLPTAASNISSQPNLISTSTAPTHPMVTRS
jgi:hypothetical protein